MRAIDAAWIGGRVLLGGFYLFHAFNHLLDADSVAAAAASKGVPLPLLAALGTGMLLLLGAVTILGGFLPRVGLAALAIFFLGVTPVMHDFWNVADPAARQLQTMFFLRNGALLGSTLMLMAFPTPWPYGAGEVIRRYSGERATARY